MGKIENGFSSGFRGKLGNTVGYMWRGKWCIRALPGEFHDAKTDRQVMQRRLFKETIGFASQAKRVIKMGLHMQSVKNNMTECNYFMRINKECFSLNESGLEVDYSSLILSEGPVAPVAFNAPRLIDDTTINIDFEKNPLHRVTNSDDEVILAVYCPELNVFDTSNPVCRRNNRLEMKLHPYWAGREVHLWGFVKDSSGRASMSQYIGCGILTSQPDGEETDNDIFTSVEEDSETMDTVPATATPGNVTTSFRTQTLETKTDSPLAAAPD